MEQQVHDCSSFATNPWSKSVWDRRLARTMRISKHGTLAAILARCASRLASKLVLIVACFLATFSFHCNAFGQTPTPEFMPLDAAKPAIEKLGTTDGHQLNPTMSSQEWLAWLQRSDAQMRQRLDVGEEDSLTNLLRFGVTYTKEYRIDDEYLVRYGQSSLVDSFAENRANDLIKALAAPNRNQGFQEMRAFVESKGFSVNSPAGEKKLKAYLLANLARMQKEFLQAQSESKSDPNKSFQHRGISLDSNLWPDYDLDLALQALLQAKMLQTGQVERVAIVGPGLDFVNKQEGVNYSHLNPLSLSPCSTRCCVSHWLSRTKSRSTHWISVRGSICTSRPRGRTRRSGKTIPFSCRGTQRDAGATNSEKISHNIGEHWDHTSENPLPLFQCHPNLRDLKRRRSKSPLPS